MKSKSLRVGLYVKHLSRDIEGRIGGTTTIRAFFECSRDLIEYRVATKQGQKICSPEISKHSSLSGGRVIATSVI